MLTRFELVVAWGGLAVGGLGLLIAGAVGALPIAAPLHDVTLASTRVSWLVPVLGMSLLAAAVAYVAGILGARRLGARVASFVGLTEVLFAVLFAWLLLGQTPGPVQLAGGVLVVAGIALVRLDQGSDTAAGAVYEMTKRLQVKRLSCLCITIAQVYKKWTDRKQRAS